MVTSPSPLKHHRSARHGHRLAPGLRRLAMGAALLVVGAGAVALLPNHPAMWFGLGAAGAGGALLVRAGLSRLAWLGYWRGSPDDGLPTPAEARLLDDLEHELRTPLAALMLVGENALSTLPPQAAGREAIESMLEEAEHIRSMLQQLLLLSRCATNAINERDRTVEDPAELARQCVEMLSVVAEAKQQYLSFSAEPVPAVSVVKPLLKQAMVNLVHNAIEHCPAGARISVWVREDRLGRAALSVQDDGPGIGRDVRQRIFRRFDRGSATTRGGSRGLGLSNALAIARFHGGTVDLVTEIGRGSRFTLRLPVARIDGWHRQSTLQPAG